MAELPTPHSIAVGTLLLLYYDPDSPLIAPNSRHDNDDDDDDIRHHPPPRTEEHDNHDDDDDGMIDDVCQWSDAEWRMRLMSLLKQIILNEDEGYVVLDSIGDIEEYEYDDDDPAENRVVDYRVGDYHRVETNDGRGGEDGAGDGGRWRRVASSSSSSIANDNGGGDFGDWIFDDDVAVDLPEWPRGPRDASFLVDDARGRGPRLDPIHAGSLGFYAETLSTLLDRIDGAFYAGVGGGGKTGTWTTTRTWRSPPSRALLSILIASSASVDDLMNLLDSWHALLGGTYVGRDGRTSAIAVDGESSFGVYLRRLCLGMEEIPFEALGRLWDALRGFIVEETSYLTLSGRRRWQRSRQGVDDGMTSRDEANCENEVYYHRGTSSSCDWLPSTPQIERIVRNACLDRDFDTLMSGERPWFRRSIPLPSSSSSSAITHHRHRPPRRHGAERRRLYDLLETHPECPSIHFLLFLSSLASGYRTKALESLHRYFDYAMIHERKERAERALMMQAGGAVVPTTGIMGTLASGMGGITGGMTGGIMQQQQQQQQIRAGGGAGSNINQMAGKISKESNVMQYAAILLAQTYYRFGYARLSLQATEEAIRIAQQSGDVECVCFANAWMAFVSSTVGGYSDGGRHARGNKCLFAKIGGVDAVIGGGVLTRNRYFRPLAPPPSYIGGRRRRLDEEESMLLRVRARASERGLSSLAAHASLELARRLAYRRHDAGSENGYDGLGDNGGESSYGMFPSDATRILGRQNIAIAGLWESTGHKSLASLSFYAAMFGTCEGGTNRGDEKAKSTAMSRVLSSFAHGPGLDIWQGSRRTNRRRRGEVYVAILNRLALLGNSGWIASSSVAISTLHEWAVRSCDLSLAQSMNTLLANRALLPCPPSAVGGGVSSAVESALTFLVHSTHLFRQRGEYDRAKRCARRACWLANRHGLSFQHGWNLLQLALIDLESAPTRAPERALTPLLECLALSEKLSMDSLRALALSTLAKIFLYIGGEGGGVQRCQKARATIRAAMPLVMQHGHVWFQGEAFLNLAKCYLAEATAKEESMSNEDRKDCGGTEKRNQFDSTVIELRQSALAELKKAELRFEQIDDIQRLRQVYYLQARVCHLLPNAKKKRDYFAKMFLQLSLEVREKLGNPVMASTDTQMRRVTR
ncbi:hypothetical protein ACHAXA_000466 [Cyclostephanos tholiformis]|uniref:Anaphase-promoting complex subunit 5 n=1 Tax=Cyclostephanos tholiformis TaxID=382380 RepID=A0ABD3RGB4_9STRA